jgi:hypothetical protein
MFIDNDTKLRVNINGHYKGFSRLDTPEIRAAANVVEIPDPMRGDEKFYYNTEQDTEPYLIVTPKNLESVREQLKTEIKQYRDLKETSGTPYLGKVFETDQRSMDRIQIAVMTAQIVGAPFSIVWTTEDNSEITLDYAGMLGLPVAIATYANQLHTTAKSKKAEVDTLDFDSLVTYDVHDGWPN